MSLKLRILSALSALMTDERTGAPRPLPPREQLLAGRIAVTKLDAIGDLVLATTFLRTLERELPEAAVTLFCRQPAGDLARQQFPRWDVVELPPRRSTLKNILWDRTTRRRLKAFPAFDLLVDLRAYRDFTDTVLASWIPARHKLALQNALQPVHPQSCVAGEERIYDRFVARPDALPENEARDLHYYRHLAEAVFPNASGAGTLWPRLQVTAAEQAALRTRLANALPEAFLLVCPGARAAIRQYPVAALAQSLNLALKDRPLPIVIAGSREETAIATELTDTLQRAGHHCVNVTGTLNLAAHVALMSLARAVVCMETSHAHIAGGLNRPAVVILGGGHFGLFAPWGESPRFRWVTNRLPCFHCHWNCPFERPKCITEIPPEQIASNLAGVLEAQPTEVKKSG